MSSDQNQTAARIRDLRERARDQGAVLNKRGDRYRVIREGQQAGEHNLTLDEAEHEIERIEIANLQRDLARGLARAGLTQQHADAIAIQLVLQTLRAVERQPISPALTDKLAQITALLHG